LNWESLIDSYVASVATGERVTNLFEKLAVDRYIDDLRNGKKRGLKFDKSKAFKFLKFSQICKHVEGHLAGLPIQLEDWQAFIVWNLFGWYKEIEIFGHKQWVRRFQEAYVDVARKNGKTTFAAIIILFAALVDGEVGAQCYTAGTKMEQAKICYEASVDMAKGEKHLLKHFKPRTNALLVPTTRSFVKPLPADSKKLDGLNIHAAICDEYHAHLTAGLWSVIRTGMGARRNPFLFTITTAGFNKQGPCYQYRDVCMEILKGIKNDDSIFAIIFTLDKDDDWSDPKVWAKSNPNLEVSVSLDSLRIGHQKAKNDKTYEVEFKTKNLNIWVDAAEVWIPDEIWMQGEAPPPIETQKGECFAGLDLAASQDFNALVLIFPHERGDLIHYDVYPYFWIPEAKLDDRKENIHYRGWEEANYLSVTDGNLVDDNTIKAQVAKIVEPFNLKWLAFDRFKATHGVVQYLMSLDLPLMEFGQGFISMDQPVQEINKLSYQNRLHHGGNPILRWMAGNVVIKINETGAMKMDKSKSKDKIDGMVALAMAIGVATMPSEEDQESIYAKLAREQLAQERS